MHFEVLYHNDLGGLILIGAVAFLLGIAVTAFCYVLREVIKNREK